jgi:hypothetical protein
MGSQAHAGNLSACVGEEELLFGLTYQAAMLPNRSPYVERKAPPLL